MKNSTTTVIIAIWFIIVSLIAFLVSSPEIFEATHTVSGFGTYDVISNMTAILCMVVPSLIVGIVLITSFVWHKEKENNKVIAK